VKHAIEVTSCGMMCMLSFVNICSGVKNVIGRDTYTHTHTLTLCDMLLFIVCSNECRLKRQRFCRNIQTCCHCQ
jgi:hypothetical protein